MSASNITSIDTSADTLRAGKPVALPRRHARAMEIASAQRRAEELLRKINGDISRLEVKIAQFSSPAILRKLEQDQQRLKLRAAAIVNFLENRQKAISAAQHGDQHHEGEDDCHDGHEGHHSCEGEALHELHSDTQRSLHESDRHMNMSDTANPGSHRVLPMRNPTVLLGMVMHTAGRYLLPFGLGHTAARE